MKKKGLVFPDVQKVYSGSDANLKDADFTRARVLPEPKLNSNAFKNIQGKEFAGHRPVSRAKKRR